MLRSTIAIRFFTYLTYFKYGNLKEVKVKHINHVLCYSIPIPYRITQY